MDATMTGDHNNEYSRAKTGKTGTQILQQSNEENTSVSERGTRVLECVPELICIKQEPLDVDIKEEMALENEVPVLANCIKKRWHQFGLELPQHYDQGFVKQEISDEISQECEHEASNSNLDTTSLVEPSTINEEEQMVFGKEEAELYERSAAQKTSRRISPRNVKQVERLGTISAFNEQHLSLRNESECFDEIQMQDSAFTSMLLDRDELYKNQECARKSVARVNETPQQRRRRLDKMCDYINEKRATENTDEREDRLSKLRLREAQRRANETPEQRSYRLSQNRLYARKRRASQSQEEREQRLLQGRLYEAQRRANETSEQREQRLIRMRLSEAKRRANETTEGRERRLVRTRVTEAQRRANESSEKRERRLIRMRLIEAQRRAHETQDERANRLARTRMTEAQRRANETTEEREKRLVRMRLNEAQRRANETPEEREKRLLRMRLNEAQRRANETPEERENRLNRMRLYEAQRRANETAEEREQRLNRIRWSVARRRVNEISDKDVQLGIAPRYKNETPLNQEHHLIANTQIQTDITEEQIKNFNMYLNIARQIENKTLEQCVRYSTELGLSTPYQVPKEQELFLLNMHLSKIQEGRI